MGPPQATAEPVAKTLKQEARFGAAFLHRYGWRLLLLFVGLLLPLWGFAALVDELREGEGFFFDAPILQFAHGMANAGFDRVFLLFSAIGYAWGVIPFDVVMVLVLAIKRRAREGLFVGIALAGSALLNLATKQLFARERPSLWESIAPETSFSFPSGHAMGSMTLAWVCVLLAWRTRWRWPVTGIAALFVVIVGLSRVYLGVHYPSDILAGWTAASVWTAASFFLVFGHQRIPWQRRGVPRIA
jgi:membrane-associated phospholipid phosphatase